MIAPDHPVLKWPCQFAAYSAGELARISSMSPDMQRLWRRRGYMPHVSSGHARFSPRQAIEVSIRYALSKRGVPPSESPHVSDEAVAGALYHAILGHAGSCEVIGPAEQVDDFLGQFEWDDFAMGLAGYPEATNYLVWDDDGTSRVVDAPDALFTGSIVIAAVDLSAVAASLVISGRKPVISIEAPADLPGRRVRRLNGLGANDS